MPKTYQRSPKFTLTSSDCSFRTFDFRKFWLAHLKIVLLTEYLFCPFWQWDLSWVMIVRHTKKTEMALFGYTKTLSTLKKCIIYAQLSSFPTSTRKGTTRIIETIIQNTLPGYIDVGDGYCRLLATVSLHWKSDQHNDANTKISAAPYGKALTFRKSYYLRIVSYDGQWKLFYNS